MSIIAIFNPASGVGKTFLAYHLAWMFRDLGLEVIVADLDPQAKLTAAFLDEDELEDRCSVLQQSPQEVEEQLTLFCGDMSLLTFEEEFSKAWHLPLNETSIISDFWRVLEDLAQSANIVLLDLGSNLGAINRSALSVADYVVVPLIPDLFSVQALKYLGASLRKWGIQRLGKMLGYVIFQQPILLYRGTNTYPKWMMQIPNVYHHAILNDSEEKMFSLKDDPYCLKIFKTYYSLIPLAQEARKPIFHLKPADGALGAYGDIIPTAYREFQQLALKIAKGAGIEVEKLF